MPPDPQWLDAAGMTGVLLMQAQKRIHGAVVCRRLQAPQCADAEVH